MPGGKRVNSGRKPFVAASKHASNAEKKERDEVNQKLITTNKLSCPKYLSEMAKKEWRRIMRLYKQMDTKILCDLDVAALVMYCEAWAVYKKAQEQWTKLNVVATTNPASQKVIDTCLDTMNKQTTVVSRLSEQLCLTPVGRARMGINPAKNKKDELADFMNR